MFSSLCTKMHGARKNGEKRLPFLYWYDIFNMYDYVGYYGLGKEDAFWIRINCSTGCRRCWVFWYLRD